MRRSVIIMAALLPSALMASSTEVEPYESFFGFSFVRFNPNSSILPSFNAPGGDYQFVYNVNSRVGVVADLGAVTKGELNHFGVDSTVVHFTAGPRFKFHGESRFQPFAQMLFGGAYSTASTKVILPSGVAGVPAAGFIVNPDLPVAARLVVSRAGFSMLAGGGIDIKISKHVAMRPVGVDYYLVRLPGPLTGNPQTVGNFRYSAGVNFLFGQQ